jgi:hypothetical protein
VSRREGPPRDGTLEERMAWRHMHERREKIRGAALSYVGAMVAARDAKRLITVAFGTVTTESRAILHEERINPGLECAIELAAVKEAADLVALYDSDPQAWPQGRTAAEALAYASGIVKARYRRGRCTSCKGPALACAKRHADGLSCP